MKENEFVIFNKIKQSLLLKTKVQLEDQERCTSAINHILLENNIYQRVVTRITNRIPITNNNAIIILDKFYNGRLKIIISLDQW